MSDQQPTARAADIAERIVDEISQAHHDWPAIELRARELVDVLAGLAAGHAPRPGPGPPLRRGCPGRGQAHASAPSAPPR
jgi:hypothetical protein